MVVIAEREAAAAVLAAGAVQLLRERVELRAALGRHHRKAAVDLARELARQRDDDGLDAERARAVGDLAVVRELAADVRGRQPNAVRVEGSFDVRRGPAEQRGVRAAVQAVELGFHDADVA
jgi:hypothetical protein